MAQFYPLTVKQVKPLTPSSVAITFSIPKEHLQTFQFVPGQYITIKKELKGKELRRAYSISSSPKQDTITIGIKKIDGGGFSDYANTKLAEGDILEVMPPDGRFVFKNTSAVKNIAAIAAGSGITPIMSIAKSVLDSNADSTFVLVYGNKSYKETMFYTDLMKLQLEYANRFFVYFTNSQTKEDNALFGRIDVSTIKYALEEKHNNLSFDGYYLCGPEAMIKLASSTLEEQEVAKDKIHFELFTATEIKEELPVATSGKTQVTVIVDEEEFSLEMNSSEIVLDAILKQNIDAPYSCQGGVCSSCICRVSEGKAEMFKNQILTDGEIEEGLILACQAHPTTPTITLDFDDV